MTTSPRFRLIPLADLLPHEQIHGPVVRELADHIRRVGVVEDPIWVAVGSNVIINGHHRVAALRSLGAERAPAWMIPYESSMIRLERWQKGPPIAHEEVVRRATHNELYSPKTTRHVLVVDLPRRPTPLARLFGPAPARAKAAGHRRASGRSPAPGVRTPGSG
jgi:L-serine kinase (ADP)